MRSQDSSKSQPIRNLQSMLRIIGQDAQKERLIIPDGTYGADTSAAVSSFQREHDLPVTGVADQQTWDAIVDAYEGALINSMPAQPIEVDFQNNNAFPKGEKNAALELVQSMLGKIAEKYSCISPPEITGIMDDLTENALFEFQNLCSLNATGCIEKITWKNLVLQYMSALKSE